MLEYKQIYFMYDTLFLDMKIGFPISCTWLVIRFLDIRTGNVAFVLVLIGLREKTLKN
jgi:hypothetical protein